MLQRTLVNVAIKFHPECNHCGGLGMDDTGYEPTGDRRQETNSVVPGGNKAGHLALTSKKRMLPQRNSNMLFANFNQDFS